MRVCISALVILLFTLQCFAQEAPGDSIPSYELEPVVITATRTMKDLVDVPVPVTVISAKELQTRGALRLTDALIEVTGLTVNHDHGAGIQVQGFDADYTLILLDGEPVIGRTAGTLDLERLTVVGIERIEIVHGPSSSLYGSEALAGVINIITRKADAPLATSLNSRYGTHNTVDVAATVEATHEKMGIRALFDRYSSSGYDLTPERYGPTTPEFTDYTADVRAHLDAGDRTKFTLGARLAVQDQHSGFALSENAGKIPHTQEDDQFDWSLHPQIRQRFSSRLEATGTFYLAHFSTETRQTNEINRSLLFTDGIDQNYRKAEVQTNVYWNTRHLTVFGSGLVWESLGGERYSTFQPDTRSQFVFAQHEWAPSRLFDINVSARFDAHEDYASRISPKFSLLVRPTDDLRLRFSVGSGFKAPAFRQLYLNFTNAAAGYSVLGSTQVQTGLARLEADGLIESAFVDPTSIEEIQAERSVAFNVGASAKVTSWLDASVGLFHNNVRDLIETQPIAQKTNGSFVFGYFNLNRIYTRGANLELNATPRSWAHISIGYQYLQARDRDVVDAIRDGRVFGRLLSGREYQLSLSDYAGLPGRSPHSGTIRTTFSNAKLRATWSIRGLWRSQYGYRDLDGNAIANLDEELVPGYMLWHTTATKSWPIGETRSLTAQLGVNNLFDVTKPNLIPSLAGRTLFTSLQVSF